MLKKESGITLITLVVTIVVLIIVAGISITGGTKSIKEAKDRKYLSELKIVQHAILERYTKYKLTKDESLLIGTKISNSNLPSEVNWILKNDTSNQAEKAYYVLISEQLKDIDLTHEENDEVYDDEYIVNYYTGEVYNNKIKTTLLDSQKLYITLESSN